MTVDSAPIVTGSRRHVSAHAAYMGAASLAGAFEQACARWSERTAVTLGDQSMTYAELQHASQRVAAELQKRGVMPGALVAILLPRSMEMVAAMLGVIAAGAAYLPLDTAYPTARTRETLEDSGAVLLLTNTTIASTLPISCVPFCCADQISLDAAGLRSTTSAGSGRDDLAYVIYTSGSTGRPKGVMVSHGNVLRLFEQTEAWFQFNEHDVWTMFHSFAFDFSVWEMWGGLLTGGQLVIVPFEVSRSPEEFYALLSAERVTVLNQTPSAFALLMQVETQQPVLPLALRYVIFGGEALVLHALQPWIDGHGDASPRLINMYGITETTVHVTYRPITTEDVARETDSLIGEPIPDLQVHLLDEHLRPVAMGEIGEICVGGSGVSLGYLGRPELTAERFVADPFGGANARLYRSGDLARRRADGEVVYLGRGDSQVKINGFRIELGEIEAALLSHAEVTQACVIAHTDASGAKTLAAYFVAADGVEEQTLRDHLRATLPAHMRPAHLLRQLALPLTGNGKVDRKALPSPFAPEPPLRKAVLTTEDRVAAMWCEVLQIASVDPDANFFDAGGTSLRLITLRAALQKEFNRSLPVTWMFECTTVRSFAARLASGAVQTARSNVDEQDKSRRQREALTRMRTLRSVAQ